jgi:signal transduction histidine kinase/HAMP domain-containing protein
MFAGLRKIAFKLAFLAGIPVIGALLLSGEIANGARERARSAEAIGSIEDLAELSSRMTDSVNQLQTERAMAALVLGLRGAEQLRGPALEAASAAFAAQEKQTDASVAQMEAFLHERDLSRMPRRLQGDLRRARDTLRAAPNERDRVAHGTASISQLLEFYGSTNEALIDATAALTRLSSDGEMLRALSSLVAVLNVQECESREHAVLSHTFAVGEFAPGMYRYLVTLMTEQRVHAATIQSFATAEQVAAYRRTLTLPTVVEAGKMLEHALLATEGSLGSDANEWFVLEASAVRDLADVAKRVADDARQIASRKLAEARRAVRYGAALVVMVVFVSSALAILIGRSITRSVLSLVNVAGKVQREHDFSLRAPKTTADEVGTLTEAFNEMLVVIQERERDLRSHRENLEKVVSERTLELSRRNEDMRLVLDTVEQGLATLDESGCIAAERSRAFDRFFGAPRPGVTFFEHIAQGDTELANDLRRDWERIASRPPAEVQLAPQGKGRWQIDARHFAIAHNPILQGARMTGSLLTISDVTLETAEAAARDSLEKELQLAQKLEGVGQLAAGVAHEINTPMQYVGDNLLFLSRAFDSLIEHLGDVSTALASSDDPALAESVSTSKARLKLAYLLKNVPKALHDSSEGVSHVSNIVRAMKSFAHVDGDEQTTGDLNQSIRDTLVVAQNEYKSVAVLETALEELPKIMCFPGRINQVLLNLIVNAAHAVADAQRDSGGKIRVSSHVEDDMVCVTVSDNGVGIPAHIRSKVFDPFFTTKAVGKGTGQGLSIARSIIVDAHGGTLSFESELGEGTTFTFKLPIDGRAGGLRSSS